MKENKVVDNFINLGCESNYYFLETKRLRNKTCCFCGEKFKRFYGHLEYVVDNKYFCGHDCREKYKKLLKTQKNNVKIRLTL